MGRVLFVFLDGIGIGPHDPQVNPFFSAALPTLRRVLQGQLPSLEGPSPRGISAKAFPVDACLGVEGIPQSGTGQIALLTGRNAPKEFGRHFGPWPPVRLRAGLARENFLVRAAARGARVAFANAYPRDYPGERHSRRVAALPLAAYAAGVLDRDHEALEEGKAVASEIVNDAWIEHLGHLRVPRITPREAGVNLGRISEGADLTVYAHYLTDEAGHRGGLPGAIEALERVDALLGGILDVLPDDALLVIASDHGNLEDARGGHTRNPVLGLLIGSHALNVETPGALTDIAGLILDQVANGLES